MHGSGERTVQAERVKLENGEGEIKQMQSR
jgi:hypothetical protein